MKSLAFSLAFLVVMGLQAADNATTFDPQKVREAQERMAVKAATQPSEAEKLKKENAELKALVALLRRRIGKLEAESRQTVKAGDDQSILHKGMTYGDVANILGSGADSVIKEDGKMVSAIWLLTHADITGTDLGTFTIDQRKRFVFFFDKGKVTRWSESGGDSNR